MAKIKTCAVCGAPIEIIPHGTNRLYCSEACRRAAHREQAKKHREERKPPSLTHFLTVTECARCQTCAHMHRSPGTGLRSCDYIIDTGEPRGCDVSETCARYERKGAKNADVDT